MVVVVADDDNVAGPDVAAANAVNRVRNRREDPRRPVKRFVRETVQPRYATFRRQGAVQDGEATLRGLRGHLAGMKALGGHDQISVLVLVFWEVSLRKD